jgi:rhodanese-related sulfurtransferase
MSTRTIDDLLESARAGLDRLTPEAAALEMADGGVLVDTRCAEGRHSDGVIPGAVHVPLSVLYWRVDESSDHHDPRIAGRDRRLILLCAHGYSSSIAAATLRTLGFGRATDVIGGFEAWRAAGLPVEPARPPDQGRVSRRKTATTTPDAAVITATSQIAAAMPAASATTPATTAPAANPRSRHSR